MTDNKLLMPIQMFEHFAKTQPNEIYWRQPVDRVVQETTWAEAYQKTLRLAAGLRSLGLQPGDKVSILSENCAEWFLADFAIIAAGLVSVPIYFTAGEKVISYVLEHSGAKAIVVGKLSKTADAEAAIPEDMITLGTQYKSLPCQHQIDDLIERNEPLADVAIPNLDDMFSITYTSGSTGNPKGVLLTYKNIVFGGSVFSRLMEEPGKMRLISYLPLAHITERACIEYTSLYNGATVSFNESLATFSEDLRDAKVTAFLSVPRLWMKFQAGVLANIPQEKLDALLANPTTAEATKMQIKMQLGLADATICGSGSAPIARSILEWYSKLGIEIGEGWGMTETCGLATSHYPFREDKIGTIGQAVEGLEVKISDEGEILIRGDAVFSEYYNNPEATSETFVDGWMRTGDRASIDDEGYLRITGRVKEQFKTQKGKYVVPVPIESLMLQNQLIEQICVMGSGLPSAMAVVVLSPEISGGRDQDEISKSLASTLTAVNDEIEKHECVAAICIAKETWDIENGLLTPTLKIKRDLLEKKYLALISTETKESVVWE